MRIEERPKAGRQFEESLRNSDDSLLDMYSSSFKNPGNVEMIAGSIIFLSSVAAKFGNRNKGVLALKAAGVVASTVLVQKGLEANLGYRANARPARR